MSSLLTTIKELLTFYIKTNYEKYLVDHKLNYLEKDKINGIISEIYYDKKEHSKIFVKESMKQMYKEEYPGDSNINLLLYDIYEEDSLMIKKMENEIIRYQEEKGY